MAGQAGASNSESVVGDGRKFAGVRRLVSWIWALLPLVFALPSAPCFAYAAWRLRSRALAMEAAAYLALSVLWVVLANQAGSTSDAGAIIAIAAAAVACTRALMLRERVFFPHQSPMMSMAGSPDLSSATQASAAEWTPRFPADHSPLRDPNNPETWVSPVACTGRDRHRLSVSAGHAAPSGLAGAGLIALDVHFHVYGRGFGVGIALLIAPLFAALFARWVDGPVLYYRTWGKLHELRLDTVTAVSVSTTRGSTAVDLKTPGLPKPVRISLRSRGYTLAPAARDHLRGWLSAPSVQWSPAAVTLFDGHTEAATRPARRRGRVLAATFTVVLPLALLVFAVAVAWHRNSELAIKGAPGYHRFGGPHGDLLAVGRPWGQPCQPIRLTVEEHVPDWVYTQVVAVTSEARRDGIDVTVETRNFYWTPSALYYPPGQSPSSVQRVPVFQRLGTPPRASEGRPTNINFGWDAQLDPDGQHEDLTYIKGDLWLQSLEGEPQALRRSIRRLIALTQGIRTTSRHDSGLGRRTKNDRFSPADIAAMKLMSGCGSAASH